MKAEELIEKERFTIFSYIGDSPELKSLVERTKADLVMLLNQGGNDTNALPNCTVEIKGFSKYPLANCFAGGYYSK